MWLGLRPYSWLRPLELPSVAVLIIDLSLPVGCGYGWSRFAINQGSRKSLIFGEVPLVQLQGKPIRLLRDEILGPSPLTVTETPAFTFRRCGVFIFATLMPSSYESTSPVHFRTAQEAL